MHRIRICRRSFLFSGLAIAGGTLLAGCGGSEPQTNSIKAVDPAEKAKDSMDFYKSNHLKKGAKK